MSILIAWFLFTSVSPISSYFLQLLPPYQLTPFRKTVPCPRAYFDSSRIELLSRRGNDDYVDENKNIGRSNDKNSIDDTTSFRNYPHVSIEYCAGCRWLLRSSWLMQEILTTFEQEMESVTLIPIKPPAPGGTFLITSNSGNTVLWDRRVDGGFPEAKQLKQRVRDVIAPSKSLGHSEDDTVIRNNINDGNGEHLSGCIECEEERNNDLMISSASSAEESSGVTAISPNISITYCTKYGWLSRSAWISQEVLTAFQDGVNSVTLIPIRPLSHEQEGQFIVQFEGKTIWEKCEGNPFPTFEQLKQKIQDQIDGTPDKEQDIESIDDLDDDEAAHLREFFGVM